MWVGSYCLGLLLTGTMISLFGVVRAAPIHDAALDGDSARVEQLLNEGADVNAPDDAGTPLQWALFANQFDTVRVLLDRGADPNVESSTGTPLQTAVLSGNVEIVRLLLQHGADPNRGDRSTPMIAAASKGNLEMVELLLAQGADPNFANFDRFTALHEAAKLGDLPLAKALVERGADVNALTAVGAPPIHFAVVGNHQELVRYLREQGAAPGEIAPITDLLATADPAAGEAEARDCGVCHKFEKDLNYYGPSLWDVVGRPRGSMNGFDYSPAFKSLEGVWTFEALNEFLARPAEVIPGTQMGSFGFPGIPDPQRRANVIAYLRTLSDSPVPLP